MYKYTKILTCRTLGRIFRVFVKLLTQWFSLFAVALFEVKIERNSTVLCSFSHCSGSGLSLCEYYDIVSNNGSILYMFRSMLYVIVYKCI